jgi:hypothetical protein
MKKLVLATAAVLALLSVAANAQGWAPMGQRQGPTAAGRDEGVTSPSPVISGRGRLRAGPYLFGPFP